MDMEDVEDANRKIGIVTLIFAYALVVAAIVMIVLNGDGINSVHGGRTVIQEVLFNFSCWF